MGLHANARLSPLGRQLLCERVRKEHWTVAEAAHAANVSERTVYRWLARYDSGEPMTDRSSRPISSPNRTPVKVEIVIERLRRSRKTSPVIAAILGMAVSTVCAVLARLGLNRLSRLEPVEPPNRYCRRHPGELIHLDVKKLGRFSKPGKRIHGQGPGRRSRGAGWEAVHVAIDDTSRLAYVEILPNETAVTTVGFLQRAVAWFAAHGVTVQEVLTDNGSPYRSALWAAECASRGIGHLRTKPYRPRTNGKAERFIQTMLREWAYGQSYPSSAARARQLPRWLRHYNHTRLHGSLGHKPPISVLTAA
jgi:transposase InsO family protein